MCKRIIIYTSIISTKVLIFLITEKLNVQTHNYIQIYYNLPKCSFFLITELKLNVQMETPKVLIPTRAKDFIVADFGNLTIDNQFIMRDGNEVNSYSVVLADMRIIYFFT